MFRHDSFDLKKLKKENINKYNIQDKNILTNYLEKELTLLINLDLEFNEDIEKFNNILKNIDLQEKNNTKFFNIEKINSNIKLFNCRLKKFEEEQDKNEIIKKELSKCLKKEINEKLKFMENIKNNSDILENKKIKLSNNLKITELNLKKKKILDYLKKIDEIYKEEKDKYLKEKIVIFESFKEKKKILLYEFQNKSKEGELMIEKNKNLNIHEINLIKLSLTKIKEDYDTKTLQIDKDQKNFKIEIAKKILYFNSEKQKKKDNTKKEISNINNKILLIKEDKNNLNNDILECKKYVKEREDNIKNYELKILNLKNYENDILTLKKKKIKEEEKYNNIDIFYKNKISHNLNTLKEKKIKVKKNKNYINKKKKENEERKKSILNLINNLKSNGNG